ncbi:hypothetical protein LJC11_04090 [Bacteroidales bacterium OttesenSCG-928-I21]|nr:hypothetical protein [Bacteroidales bacterium OttesenSCG-928-I21]
MVRFLISFFFLFEAKIKALKITGNEVIGTIEWEGEEDIQDFCWEIPNEQIDFSQLTSLCVFIRENNLIYGDQIIISYDELLKLLKKDGWNFEYAKSSLDYLCSFEIKMIDDGEETDSFYVHF